MWPFHRYHFALRLRRQYRSRFKRMSADEQRRFIVEKRERGDDVSRLETDPRERRIQFLRSLVDERSVPAGRSNPSPCSNTRPIPTNRAADIWLPSPTG